MRKVAKVGLNDIEVRRRSFYLFKENIFFWVGVLVITDLFLEWELRQVFRIDGRLFFDICARILFARIGLLRFYVKLRFVIQSWTCISGALLRFLLLILAKPRYFFPSEPTESNALFSDTDLIVILTWGYRLLHTFINTPFLTSNALLFIILHLSINFSLHDLLV
jgi:hypothetical protein